jgi:pimeloyl-ACP methyl ester carboxylesterase
MPVLALGGDRSFLRAMECVESLQRVAEDVCGGVVKNCGHWIAEEQPEFLAAELLRFFGSHPLSVSRGPTT